MRFKTFKIGKTADEPEEDTVKQDDETVKQDDETVKQMAGMKKKINGRTKDLEATAQKLKGLSDTAEDSAVDEPPKPHGPIGELTVEPADDLFDMDTEEDISSLLDDSDEEITVVEVNTGVSNQAEIEETGIKSETTPETEEPDSEAAATPEAEETAPEASIASEQEAESAETEVTIEVEKEPKQEDDSDSFNNLFSEEEEEVNPLANLISSLPDVTAQELIDDLQELKEIMRERHQS